MIADDYYVVLKLVSGEQVMATLIDEDDTHVVLHNPMIIRILPYIDKGKTKEQVTAVPLCQFSDDEYYRIPRSSFMFLKTLHEMLIPHYNRIVEEQSESVLAKSNKDGDMELIEELFDGENLTVEEIHKRIEMLEELADEQEEIYEPEEDIEEVRSFVAGNETLH